MFVEIEAAGGTMRAYVSRPQGGARGGIIVFQEAYGVNAHIQDVSDRLAALGLLALAPELFHRTAQGFDAPYDTEGAWEKIEPHYAALSADGIAEDTRRSYDWLRGEGGVSDVAAIGFCMGGRAAYVANAAVPLRCAVSFYGGGIVPDLLPLAEKQSGPILMFWGGRDANIPPAQYRAVADALDAAEKPHEQVVFSDAGHGFFCDRRKSYHAEAASQSWALLKEFLA